MNNTRILSENLTASNRKGPVTGRYRAVLDGVGVRPLVRIEQEIGGEWSPTPGQWYLASLLDRPSDAISIDFGQGWAITSGMLKALARAQTIAAEAE